jgi:hypothetical protein
MDSVPLDWLDTAGSTLAIGLLMGSFALIAVLLLSRRSRS